MNDVNKIIRVEEVLKGAIDAVKYPILSTIQERLIKELTEEIEARHGCSVTGRVSELEAEIETKENVIDGLREEIREFENKKI